MCTTAANCYVKTTVIEDLQSTAQLHRVRVRNDSDTEVRCLKYLFQHAAGLFVAAACKFIRNTVIPHITHRGVAVGEREAATPP